MTVMMKRKLKEDVVPVAETVGLAGGSAFSWGGGGALGHFADEVQIHLRFGGTRFHQCGHAPRIWLNRAIRDTCRGGGLRER